MEFAHTVRVRQEWLQSKVEDEGGVRRLADRLGVDAGSISRSKGGRQEAHPRFIGAVLATYPVQFQEAFEVIEKPVNKEQSHQKKIAA